MKLAIITASVREGRVGGMVGEWVSEFASQHSGFDEIELIDLKGLNLPVFDEPKHPMLKEYTHEHTKRWSQLIDPADAFVFVTPEYNYFTPGSLVNALNYLSLEWGYKPAGIVSYGGVSGGLRSAQAVKPLLATSRMMAIPEGVTFQFVKEMIEGGKLEAQDMHKNSAEAMLDELAKWSRALLPLHQN